MQKIKAPIKPEEILKSAREAKGFTQESIAKTLNISSRMYQRYEEGLFPKYKADSIKKIDELLGTNLHDIIYDKPLSLVEDDKSAPSEKKHALLINEGYSEIEFLKKLLKASEALVAEKEARIQTIEEHKNDWKDQNNKIMNLLSSDLQELKTRQQQVLVGIDVSVAYQMFWIDKWAEKEAKGNEEKQKALKKSYYTEVADILTGKKRKSSDVGPHK